MGPPGNGSVSPVVLAGIAGAAVSTFAVGFKRRRLHAVRQDRGAPDNATGLGPTPARVRLRLVTSYRRRSGSCQAAANEVSGSRGQASERARACADVDGAW